MADEEAAESVVLKLVEQAIGHLPTTSEFPNAREFPVLELGYTETNQPAASEKSYLYFLLASDDHVRMLRDMCDDFLKRQAEGLN
jgi:hypothetical protein